MNLDPQFVRDLTVLIAASAAGGLLMEAVRQPTINGYFIAGSVVGPGGFKLIKEIVQASACQLGKQLLLLPMLLLPMLLLTHAHPRSLRPPTHTLLCPCRSSRWLSWACSCCCSR